MRVPTLYQFFRHQVQHGFSEWGMTESTTVDYVSDVLARFAHTRALYGTRDTEGRPLEYVADMLVEWRLASGAPGGRARERLIVRHLAEYALFMSGLFRERLQARGELGYYLAHGAGAYGQWADHESHPLRRQLLRRLYADFGRISSSLDHIRRSQLPLGLEPTADNMLAAFWRT